MFLVIKRRVILIGIAVLFLLAIASIARNQMNTNHATTVINILY